MYLELCLSFLKLGEKLNTHLHLALDHCLVVGPQLTYLNFKACHLFFQVRNHGVFLIDFFDKIHCIPLGI